MILAPVLHRVGARYVLPHLRAIQRIMKAIILIVAAILFYPASSAGQAPKPTTGLGAFYLTHTQIRQLSREALEGSNKAADRLSGFYYLLRPNTRLGTYWARIGAENGEPESQYDYAMWIMHQNRSLACQERALFWLEKAAKKGNYDAQLEFIDLKGQMKVEAITAKYQPKDQQSKKKPFNPNDYVCSDSP